MNLTAGQQLYAALEVDLDRIPLDRIPLDRLDKYIAIQYFLLDEDEPADEEKNLKRVDRYLHTFQNLCEDSAWQKAGQVLSFCPMSIELHEQLRILGYYREQIALYQELLGKVSPEQDLVCLHGLARVFYNLSDFDRSLDYYRQQFELARLVNNRQSEAQAIAGLGEFQWIKRNYAEAIALFQQQLVIAREIGDQQQEGYALNSLGYALCDSGMTRNKQNYYKEGLIYLQESLEIARRLGDPEMESFCLNNISQSYFNRGQSNQVLIFLIKQLEICDRTNDKRGKYFALEDFGRC
jgi:tetratricopeptide (TPR) repeat protein